MNMNKFHPVIWFLFLKCRQANNKRSKSYPFKNVWVALYFCIHLNKITQKDLSFCPTYWKQQQKPYVHILVFCVCLVLRRSLLSFCVLKQNWKGQLDRDGNLLQYLCALSPDSPFTEWSFFLTIKTKEKG